MSSDNVYEMLWDCKFCGTTKLLGLSQKFCPVCGAAQDPKTRYFPADEDKVAVHDHRFVGADLICPACGSSNSGNAEYCTQCGAPLEQAERAGSLGQRVAADGQQFASSGSRDLAKEQMNADLGKAAAAESEARAQARRPVVIGGVIVVVVAIIGAIIFLLSTTQQGVRVTGHSWERIINIEDFAPRVDEAWQDNVPVDARGTTCTRRERSSRQVPDGEECRTVQVDQGDGTFREDRVCETKYRKEPIYDQWCTFTVDRWAYERSITATGASLQDEPYWPELNLASNERVAELEKEGYEEFYTLHLKVSDSDTTYACVFDDQAKWASFGMETVWQMEVRRAGTPLCDTLKAG